MEVSGNQTMAPNKADATKSNTYLSKRTILSALHRAKGHPGNATA